ncbi:sugar-binding transcriptional regulator [Indiicoccus explosivorum]|uniref:sugar-binding transcriptional regulator n=1 Tax=Indiicoccus explosivorum TaxID=1917864 RepID=UPI000B44FED1|nr:sugar-binding domain-containing protein [Indiicoccus explosivorum]
MNPVVDAQQKLLPEMAELLKTRYSILNTIQMEGPIGRRTLSELVHLTERDIRRETDVLRSQNLLYTRSGGMAVSSEGAEVLSRLKETMKQWSGLSELEEELGALLGIKRVVIAAQDSDEIPSVKTAIGREAARYLEKQFPSHKRVAVTGGSTVASIAEGLEIEKPDPRLEFVAARGGLGEDVLHQANTIASAFAKKTGGTCRTLYLPDRLSKEAYELMTREPFIQEMTELYNTAEIVIHGIGDAGEMAARRESTPEELERIGNGGAVGEAFGYYFDESGQAVYRIRTVGIQLGQLEKVPVILAAAGGRSKAKAILSYLKHAPKQTVLFTDEGAAKAMIKNSQTNGGKLHDFEISD